MFPPKKTQDVREFLDDLWASLQRGGEPFQGEAFLDEQEEGGFVVVLKLHQVLPKDISQVITKYIRGYGKEAGWKVDARFAKFYVTLTVSKD